MSAPKPVRRALAALTALLIILVTMGGLLLYGVQDGRAQWAPLLALDLEGGTQMVLSPQVETGEEVDDEQLEQAVEIIRQRVDGTGVAEAEIAVQGSENIVVNLPGTPDEATRELIQASADMEFRPVLQQGNDPIYSLQQQEQMRQDTLDAAEEDMSDDEFDALQEQLDQQTQQAEEEAAEAEEAQAQPEDFDEPTGEPTDASDPNWVTPELAAEFENYRCSDDISLDDRADWSDEEPIITCNPDTGATFLLGPVDVPGEFIADADFGLEENNWITTVSFDSEGTQLFADSSSRLYGLEGDRNHFGIVLDGHVIIAPSMNAPIYDGNAQISGEFTEDEARGLAEQLRYGSLPMSFQIESEQQISATLGADQLRMGLLAGLIGLLLTAGYAVYQYRALALAVTMPSLIVVGALTWWAISLLGWSDGYRLSLAGIAGLILSIGLTADSFVVYFERVKDELREGRSLAGAVESGWQRARRTILASKAVNIIAAVVLYLVAVGNVRGFAFTLGLTALIDVILVFLFTHPLMQLLARRRFFASGKRFSGLSARELGVDVLYKGAGRFSRSQVVYSDPQAAGVPAQTPEQESAAADRAQEVPEHSEEEWAEMTIAERRRARERAARRRERAETEDGQVLSASASPSSEERRDD
ncbi:protein translocase subunit SecD [Nesterenkonia sp. NBAIMH1]|uniref:protein translocase subunit SecD n=1 Tax=Nesterenkonia sp. NBAIMH1 TaxID=2600320 RepID=UPI0011B45A21|nr:protein translocase subunit SecD [Nesterenkonia sp. NBAIMH1]